MQVCILMTYIDQRIGFYLDAFDTCVHLPLNKNRPASVVSPACNSHPPPVIVTVGNMLRRDMQRSISLHPWCLATVEIA
jgi:hypothetical protein